MSSNDFEIVSINVGKPTVWSHDNKEILTGIFKHPSDKPLFLSVTNFEGDGQADLENHGGKDKAVCVYSYDHYPYWEKELNRPLTTGAFGENLTIRGIEEGEVCIGDIFQLGEAVVQISQPRQPCHKLSKKYDLPDLPIRMQNTSFTGFYFRVLQEGLVFKDKPLQLIQRHPKHVTISFANQIKYHDKQNIQGIKNILEVEELSDSWRSSFINRLQG